ncbi:MAG: ester cyclase [Solirubrobacterales bacterium]|nr:ester cyclase [Solirubrobacterales bacterium]
MAQQRGNTWQAIEGGAAQRPPQAARFTAPTDFSISLRARRSKDLRADDQGERAQPMRGYEDTYVDIIDYIVRITDRIWEDQDVGYIYDTYRPACRVYTDAGPQYGVESVVEHTMQAINAFPDVRHIADDIIWAGNEDEGFATSHRAINVGHHLGPWRWGSATGRKIQLWVIANCVSEENQIFEEWVLHNAGARLAQCGIDVRAAARIYGNSGLSLPLGEREITEVERVQGGRIPTRLAEPSADSDDIELVVRALFHNAYNRRDLSAIDRVYAPNVRWHGPTNREGYGRAEVRGMARALMATFPDLGLHVDEVYWMGNPAEGHAVSVRWTAIGTHRGFGLYGEPTGRRVHLWGLSQLYFAGGQIVEDWSLFNEFDVFAQILRDEPTELEPIRG